MKKLISILSVVAIALSTTTAFTSCGSDDGDDILLPALLNPTTPTPGAGTHSLKGHRLVFKSVMKSGMSTVTTTHIFDFIDNVNYTATFQAEGVTTDNGTGTYKYNGSNIIELVGGWTFVLVDGKWTCPD